MVSVGASAAIAPATSAQHPKSQDLLRIVVALRPQARMRITQTAAEAKFLTIAISPRAAARRRKVSLALRRPMPAMCRLLSDGATARAERRLQEPRLERMNKNRVRRPILRSPSGARAAASILNGAHPKLDAFAAGIFGFLRTQRDLDGITIGEGGRDPDRQPRARVRGIDVKHLPQGESSVFRHPNLAGAAGAIVVGQIAERVEPRGLSVRVGRPHQMALRKPHALRRA